MAYWDAENGKIVRHDPEPYPGYEDTWLLVDCGCCRGVEWGGFPPPTECRRCGGGGWIAQHKESGALAHYPGGRFCGVA